MQDKLTYRHAHITDLAKLAEIETAGFPAGEAASENSLKERIEVFGNHFILLEHRGRLVAFINGMANNQESISDDLFEDAHLHDPAGHWQMVFGLVTDPAYRHRGYAQKAMLALIAQAKDEGRRGVLLTCKEHLLGFYRGFGFVNQGVSESNHGGATWFDMRLEL